MDLGNKILNDLISKDNNISNAAAKRIIEAKDVQAFEKLCEKSEFLFDFIKEKINEKLFYAANSNNFKNTFEFIKVYNSNFEDFIIRTWVKFADEDLTDEILEIFENGTKEEKTYAAAYFYHINDPLALEYLKKYSFSDFDPLAQNSARALSKFGERELYDKAIEIIQGNTDDFDKYKYVNFLVNYGDKSAFDALYNYFKTSYTKGYAASNILYLKGFFEITESGREIEAMEIFDAILTSYPEEISLDTVFDFEIFEFIKFLARKITDNNSNNHKKGFTSYIKRLILKAKYKFNLISKEDIYTFDLNKDVKKEINDISNFLNTIKADLFSSLEEEFFTNDKERILETFDIILNYGKKEFTNDIVKIVKTSEYEEIIAEGINILKVFGELSNIQKDEILAKIKNENIKAIVQNAF